MPEKVLFETERVQRREDVATYLRTVADKLDDGGPITLESGDQSVTMEPPANVEFEVKAEREGPTDAPGELSIEFELEWDEDTSGSDGSLNIK
ncbi:amphi-Trp domain-containing protein [Halorientalis regularis]|jgi:amphi-Trp domain-containing protein|uniref:Amphi-Trp domain-containing protein n=1 Tax=Halorientalis regularis TaxID=660518 RepID=A0A1G7NQE1_9EURY|nr:amphi-Trp domain-containing protein [Halorientalis regularis]SDF75529.1 amphi-Trp domain-containing protein [Halorientalis regularis]